MNHPADSEHLKGFQPSIRTITEAFQLPTDFFERLGEEDDWSLVIKLHALLETTLGWYLDGYLKPYGLDWLIGKMDLSGGRINKIEVALQTGGLDGSQAKFIRAVSKIRNRLVHNIRHVRFDLKDYISNLPASEKHEFSSDILAINITDNWTEDERVQLRASVINAPRAAVFWNTVYVVSFVTVYRRMTELNREHEVLKREHDLKQRLGIVTGQ